MAAVLPVYMTWAAYDKQPLPPPHVRHTGSMVLHDLPGKLPKPASARNLPKGFQRTMLYGPLPKSYSGLQLASYSMTRDGRKPATTAKCSPVGDHCTKEHAVAGGSAGGQ